MADRPTASASKPTNNDAATELRSGKPNPDVERQDGVWVSTTPARLAFASMGVNWQSDKGERTRT